MCPMHCRQCLNAAAALRAHVDLKRLSHLVVLADECHFARAAERVHLSQPAFSRSIQSIERDLGMQPVRLARPAT